MDNNHKKNAAVAGLLSAAAMIGLIVFGMKYGLGTSPDPRNLGVIITYGLLVGISSASLIYFRWKVAGVVFSIGILIGIFEMLRGFSARSNGWGDLIGILSIILWPAAALALGLLLQMLYGGYCRYRNRSKR